MNFNFPAKWSFVIMRYRISHTHSCGFISFQNTRKFCLNFIGCTTPTIFHNFAGHGRSHWCFQLFTRVLDGFFKFRILGVDEIDPTQFSSIFEVDLFLRPLLLLLLLGMLSHWIPDLWPYMMWIGCKLFSRQSLPRPHISSGCFSSNRVNCVKPVRRSDKSRETSMFQ